METEEVVEILNYIKTKRLFILKVSLIFLLLGVTYSLLLPIKYQVVVKVLPQQQVNQQQSGLGGLASLAGINLNQLSNGSSGELPPALYPQIINSTNYKKRLLATSVSESINSPKINIGAYLTEEADGSRLSALQEYTIGLPKKLFANLGRKVNRIQNSNATSAIQMPYEVFDLEEKNLMEIVRNKITLGIDKRDGIITLSAEMPNPLTAAQLAENALDILKDEICRIKTQKALEEHEFTLNLYELKKLEFEEKQEQLSQFKDQNINMSTATALNRLTRLEAEFEIAFNVYSELAKQVETTRINLNQKAPTFTVLQPVVIPVERSSPNRKRTVIYFLLFGFTMSLIYLLSKVLLTHIQKIFLG